MKYILIILLAFSAIGLHAQHVDFRGANHCGIYPDESFSHPTIFDGVLYVRHGTALIAYNIKR